MQFSPFDDRALVLHLVAFSTDHATSWSSIRPSYKHVSAKNNETEVRGLLAPRNYHERALARKNR